MMWMKNSLVDTGKSAVTDSDFCVLKGILGMLAHGVYGRMVIKKNILDQVLQWIFH